MVGLPRRLGKREGLAKGGNQVELRLLGRNSVVAEGIQEGGEAVTGYPHARFRLKCRCPLLEEPIDDI